MTEKITTNKETFFSYPRTKKAIVAHRQIIEHLGRTLVDVIAGLHENEAVVTQQPLIPKAYRHAQNFLKRGPEVFIGAPRTQEQALREQRGPGRRRMVAFDRLTPETLRCGYVWTSLRDGRRRKVHLVDCLEGAKIFAYSHQFPQVEYKIKIIPYTEVRNAANNGGSFDCRVPSRSQEGLYAFLLHSVPLLKGREQYFVWTHLHSTGHAGGIVTKDKDTRCGSSTYDLLNFRSAAGEVRFCPHEIAAYFAISEQEGRSQGKVMLQPFALPTPETVKFYRKLREQVALQETAVSKATGKPRKVTRSLNEAEIELLLWQFTAKRGYLNTWYASESKHGVRLRDYQW